MKSSAHVFTERPRLNRRAVFAKRNRLGIRVEFHKHTYSKNMFGTLCFFHNFYFVNSMMISLVFYVIVIR